MNQLTIIFATLCSLALVSAGHHHHHHHDDYPYGRMGMYGMGMYKRAEGSNEGIFEEKK